MSAPKEEKREVWRHCKLTDNGEHARADPTDFVAKVEETDREASEDDGEVEP
jgi:hypothetical protein